MGNCNKIKTTNEWWFYVADHMGLVPNLQGCFKGFSMTSTSVILRYVGLVKRITPAPGKPGYGRESGRPLSIRACHPTFSSVGQERSFDQLPGTFINPTSRISSSEFHVGRQCDLLMVILRAVVRRNTGRHFDLTLLKASSVFLVSSVTSHFSRRILF
jgi:hypothetical protein